LKTDIVWVHVTDLLVLRKAPESGHRDDGPNGLATGFDYQFYGAAQKGTAHLFLALPRLELTLRVRELLHVKRLA
jgi:hypothetical protein